MPMPRRLVVGACRLVVIALEGLQLHGDGCGSSLDTAREVAGTQAARVIGYGRNRPCLHWRLVGLEANHQPPFHRRAAIRALSRYSGSLVPTLIEQDPNNWGPFPFHPGRRPSCSYIGSAGSGGEWQDSLDLTGHSRPAADNLCPVEKCGGGSEPPQPSLPHLPMPWTSSHQ